jgi:NSS family neurotransmitter:Na+ symporter
MLLMMFYTVVCGWMLDYVVKMATGDFSGLDPKPEVAGVFTPMLADPGELIGWMLVVDRDRLPRLLARPAEGRGAHHQGDDGRAARGAHRRARGARSPCRAPAGPAFYLVPDFGNLVRRTDATGEQLATFGDASTRPWARRSSRCRSASSPWRSSAATSARTARSPARAVRIGALDTFVALMAGLIIFPACFAFGVEPGQPARASCSSRCRRVFDQMPLGPALGRAVLRVHELRGAVDDHRRLREPHELQRWTLGPVAPPPSLNGIAL